MRFSKRENLFFILVSTLVLIGVGYAYLNTNLNISGIANLEKPTWNVYFDNVQITEGSVTTVTQSPTIDSNKTTITYNITLDKPGDFYEFTVDVKNDGTIDAMIEEVVSRVNGVAPGELPSYLKYSATYDNGSEILNNQLLLANQTKTYRIRIEYDSDISPNDLPQEDQSYVISFGTPFIQKSGDGEDSDYVVSFNANGGEGEMTNQIIMAHTPTALKKNTFTKEGYLFKGWNTKCDGTGTSYYDEQEVTDLGEVTLCAQWKIDAFPYVFRQDGVCTFNGSGNNITGNDCSDYANNKYIDTGVKLYSSTNINKDYEIGFTIEEYVPENNVDQATLMNTKNEASGYPGVVFRKQSNTEFELASRKTSSANEFYRFASSGVRNVKIYRINGEIFYKIDDGEKTFLNNLTQYNPTFDLNVWFGAGPTDASATTAQRYFVGKLSNMYIRLGTYVDSSIYTIELNPNGGNVEPSSISVGEGNAIGELPTPTRDLYDFDGWYTGLTDGVEVTSSYIPSDDMVLYARWTKKPTYNISFDANGGSNVEDLQIVQGEAIGELPTSVKPGKTLDGWYLESAFSTKVTDAYIPESDITLYAKWNDTTFPKVFEQEGACTFDGEFGTISGENCEDYVGQKYIDTGIYLYSETNKNKDYEIGFTIVSYNPSDNVSRATLMNTKLEATGYPGVVFRRDESTNNFILQSRKTSSANEQKTFAYNTVTSVKIYRISNEIYYSINGGEKVLLNSLSEYNPTFNLTTWFGAAPANEAGTSAQRYFKGTLSNMYIKLGEYEEVGKYIITYNTNGGGELNPSYIAIDQGASIGALPTPSREWYTFDGWYTGLTDGVKVDTNYVPDSNMTIYARWVEIPTYTITFNSNGGSSIPERKIEQGASIGTLPVPEKAEYDYAGWYTSLTDGIEVDESFVPTEDITLYARWADMAPTLYNKLKSEAINGSYAREYSGNHQDSLAITGSEKIYSWYVDPTYNDENLIRYEEYNRKNNVLFANFCWKMIRTTDTGGVKLRYHGVPTDGKCSSRLLSPGIGSSQYNTYEEDLICPAYVGYMYDPDSLLKIEKASNNDRLLYGNGVTYDGEKYTLINTQNSFDYNHHYSCGDTTTSVCENVRFYFSGWYLDHYVTLKNGKTIEQALADMLYSDGVNKTNSTIKTFIDDWYENNMLDYTDKLEDVIFCNNRKFDSSNGWKANSDTSRINIYFYGNNLSKANLKCNNITDKFSVNNEKAKLDYPVGLVTYDEILLMGLQYYTNINRSGYVTMTPALFNIFDEMGYSVGLGEKRVFMKSYYYDSESLIDYSNDVLPVVSLLPGTTYSSGDGSYNHPYIVD